MKHFCIDTHWSISSAFLKRLTLRIWLAWYEDADNETNHKAVPIHM